MPSPIDDDLVDDDLVQPSDTELQTGTGHGDDEQNGLDFSSTSPAGNGVNVLDDILDDGDFDDEIELEGDAVQGLRRVSGSVSVARSVSDGDEGEGDSKQARDDDADRSVSATSDRPEPSVSERSDSERKESDATATSVGDAEARRDRLQPPRLSTARIVKRGVRYFVMKSFNQEDVDASLRNGIWATQPRNEGKLNKAFDTAACVILIFSVNNSRHFQGYARMKSVISAKRKEGSVWTKADGVPSWGSDFEVQWLKRYDLPFTRTSHLHNPLNENKPVKISRDAQELEEGIGRDLCALIDQGATADNVPPPQTTGSSARPQRGPSAEAPAQSSRAAAADVQPRQPKRTRDEPPEWDPRARGGLKGGGALPRPPADVAFAAGMPMRAAWGGARSRGAPSVQEMFAHQAALSQFYPPAYPMPMYGGYGAYDRGGGRRSRSRSPPAARAGGGRSPPRQRHSPDIGRDSRREREVEHGPAWRDDEYSRRRMPQAPAGAFDDPRFFASMRSPEQYQFYMHMMQMVPKGHPMMHDPRAYQAEMLAMHRRGGGGIGRDDRFPSRDSRGRP